MKVSKEAMKDMYLRMIRIREFESKAQSLFADGKIPGFVHLYLGEEAVATGVCACLRDDDYITSTHRGHGHIVAKGGDLKFMMAELFGKETGYCKGKGGSMHIADPDKGILGANGIVGGGIPIAIGAALAQKYLNKDSITVVFFDRFPAITSSHPTRRLPWALRKLPKWVMRCACSPALSVCSSFIMRWQSRQLSQAFITASSPPTWIYSEGNMSITSRSTFSRKSYVATLPGHRSESLYGSCEHDSSG